METKINRLGKYKGIEVPAIKTEITDESVLAQLNMLRLQSARNEDLGPDAVAEEGDIAVIDYKGFVDGEAFEGGEDHEYGLALGSGTFIPGFEEQLIGTKAGDEKDVMVTFPEAYHAHLAGKEAVFKCKVHKIQRKKLPELDDNFVKAITGEDMTMEEFKVALKEELKTSKIEYAKQQWEDIVLEAVTNDSEVALPTEDVAKLAERLHKSAEMQMSQQGFTLAQYLEQSGQSAADFQNMMVSNATQTLKQHAVMTAIAEAEGFTVSDEEFETELASLAAQYGMVPDQIREALGEEGLKTFRTDILAKKGLQVMIDNAVEV